MGTKKATDVAGVRAQIAAVRAEMGEVDRAPLPLDEAEAALDAFLEALASAYVPPVGMFARDPAPTLDAASLLLGDVQDLHAPWVRWASVLRAPLRAAWLDRLRLAYETDPTLAHPVPRAARAERLADLQRQLVGLELEEELQIVASENRGAPIDRRADARPDILFGDAALALEVLADEVGRDPAGRAG